jgi:hypothetical protein
MKLTAEQIQANWNTFIENIDLHITGERRQLLRDFYEQYQERIMLMPAAHKKEYHNAFPGGYVEHVNRVVDCALKQYELWKSEGADVSTFTVEELVFSAINHDLGKMGDEQHESYVPQTDEWRRNKLGEDYTHSTKLAFASVPDRGLYMLQAHGIRYTFNEMLAIQTHDGLYDEANKKYLMSYSPETKPRTALPFIVHFADMMAARIEFEREWLPVFSGGKQEAAKKNFSIDNKTTTPSAAKQKALGSIKSEGLKSILDNL